MEMICECQILFSFTINLHHASADFSGNDVPIHISVRFDEGKVNNWFKIDCEMEYNSDGVQHIQQRGMGKRGAQKQSVQKGRRY